MGMHKAYSYTNKKGKTVHVAAHMEHPKGGGKKKATKTKAKRKSKSKSKKGRSPEKILSGISPI